MKKSRGILILIIFVIMGTTMGNVASVRGLKTGDFACWRAELEFLLSPSAILLFNTTLLEETDSSWLVEYVEAPSGLSVPGYTENISKVMSLGGFPNIEEGDYWGLWLNLEGVSEMETLVVDNDLIGIPIATPFTFEVERGEAFFSGRVYDAWLFMSEILYLFYDADTGLLLQAIFNDILMGSFTVELQEYTGSASKSFDFFTIDVFALASGTLILLVFMSKRRKSLCGRSRSGEQNNFRKR